MSQPRIAILGSCVTRQAFYHNEGKEPWRLERPAHYQARTSLITLLSPPLPAPERLLKAIRNPFEQRATRDDFQRNFWTKLEAARPDLLILDFVDERFDLLAAEAAGDTRYATLNDQIDQWDRTVRRRARRRIINRLRRRFTAVRESGIAAFGFRRLARFSQDVSDLWTNAASGFVQRLRAEHPRVGILLHLAPVATVYGEGGAQPRGDEWWVANPQRAQALRELLASYGRRVRELIPNAGILQVPAELQHMKRGHIWGDAPWHYGDPYYRELVRQIKAAS